MFHQQRRRGTLISANFSISNLVLDHALSPAFDVAKDVPPRKVRAARTKVIKMIVAPLGNGPIDVRDRALILIGFAGALPHSELVPRDVGKAAADRRVLRIRR
jgi:site-specific recombinase XerC